MKTYLLLLLFPFLSTYQYDYHLETVHLLCAIANGESKLETVCTKNVTVVVNTPTSSTQKVLSSKSKLDKYLHAVVKRKLGIQFRDFIYPNDTTVTFNVVYTSDNGTVIENNCQITLKDTRENKLTEIIINQK